MSVYYRKFIHLFSPHGLPPKKCVFCNNPRLYENLLTQYYYESNVCTKCIESFTNGEYHTAWLKEKYVPHIKFEPCEDKLPNDPEFRDIINIIINAATMESITRDDGDVDFNRVELTWNNKKLLILEMHKKNTHFVSEYVPADGIDKTYIIATNDNLDHFEKKYDEIMEKYRLLLLNKRKSDNK